MPMILHITAREEWEQAQARGEYRGDTPATEGFIHCCLPGRLPGFVSRYFQGQSNLVVLRIGTEIVASPLTWESPPGPDETSPHGYGTIEPDAVAGVVTLEDVPGRPGRARSGSAGRDSPDGMAAKSPPRPLAHRRRSARMRPREGGTKTTTTIAGALRNHFDRAPRRAARPTRSGRFGSMLARHPWQARRGSPWW